MSEHRRPGWQCASFGRFARVLNGADYSAVEVEEGGYPVFGSGGEFRRASSYLYDGESVLFGRKGTVDRPIYVNGRFWTVDTMFYTDIDRMRLLPRFAYYWALTLPFAAWATDTALPSMTSTAIKAAPILLPPLPEQRATADYLDRETARIDAFIAKNEELITLLTERRRAVVAQAVTKGTREGVPMRATGVDWFGQVPAHWKVSRLSRWFGVTLGKMLDESKFAGTTGDVLPYVRAANVRSTGLDLSTVNEMPFTPSEQKKYALRNGDMLVVEGGSIGINTTLGEDLPRWGFQKTVNRVRPLRDDLSEFVGFQLDVMRESGGIDMIANVSTILHFTAEKLERTIVAMPPVPEQQEIISHVREQTSSIDQAIERATRAVELARERRAALISAAVTGKIDVGVAA